MHVICHNHSLKSTLPGLAVTVSWFPSNFSYVYVVSGEGVVRGGAFGENWSPSLPALVLCVKFL